MGANLFNERFLARREPAWHRLGKVFPENEKLTHKNFLMYPFVVVNWFKFSIANLFLPLIIKKNKINKRKKRDNIISIII